MAADFNTFITLEGSVEGIISALNYIKSKTSKEPVMSKSGAKYIEYLEYIEITNKNKKTLSSGDFAKLECLSDEEILDLVENSKGKIKKVKISASGPYGNYGPISDSVIPCDLARLTLNNDFNFSYQCSGNDCGENVDFFAESKEGKLVTEYNIYSTEYYYDEDEGEECEDEVCTFTEEKTLDIASEL